MLKRLYSKNTKATPRICWDQNLPLPPPIYYLLHNKKEINMNGLRKYHLISRIYTPKRKPIIFQFN